LRLVALGDIEADAQQLLALRLSGLPPVDVVKVAHHGSASQHGRLYAQLRARVALMGVGPGNDYGHPAPRTLGLLRSDGAVVQRTDTDGDVAVVGSDRGLSLLAAHNGHRGAPRGDGHG
jgi:competence protein ComEC